MHWYYRNGWLNLRPEVENDQWNGSLNDVLDRRIERQGGRVS